MGENKAKNDGAKGGAKRTDSPLHTQEARLEALRERLYSRGKGAPERERRKLSQKQHSVPETWQQQRQRGKSEIGAESKIVRTARDEEERQQKQNGATASRVIATGERPARSAQPEQGAPLSAAASAPQVDASRADSTPQPPMPKRKNRRHYIRTRLIAAGVLFFALAVILSSAILFFGQNTISGDNITISIEGPFVVGGGEELDMQIAISNQNAVPIESATLIIEYPAGTQSATEDGKELFRERKSLEEIRSGEVLNIPAKARIFGEENEEKEVRVSVEYRVRGSNATFFKEAEPLRFKVSSSPVVISVDALKQVSSGQELELVVTIGSNSPSPVRDILVEVTYPEGFDYTEANREPVSGQNIWRIDTLPPEGEEKIIITGVLIGSEEGERVFDLRVGVAGERDAFNLASVFSTARAEVLIEESFIGLDVTVDGSSESTVAVARDESADVSITFTNTLSHTIYDAAIGVALSGNVLDPNGVRVSSGFYDSNTNTINWNSVDDSSLREITPGESLTRTFRVEASDEDERTPQIGFSVSVQGKRVSEDRVPEELTNSVSRTLRFESEIDVNAYGLYSTGPFVNTGPIQPVAGEITQYTLVLEVENGSNDITDARMSATLPSYVTWLDLVTSGDTMTYNPSTREVVWDIGDISARGDADVSFQVSVLPSQSQVGSIPTILGEQQFRATDRFTGTVLRAESSAVTTRLREDPDDDGHDGEVLAN